jgi:glycosyltransferase involved in cell wall biosynthesis
VELHVVEVFDGEVGHDAGMLVRELVQRGVDVEVVCTQTAAFRFENTGARINALAVAGGVGGIAGLRRVLRGEGVDLVHAHGLRAGLAASLARLSSTPLILTWPDPVPEGGAAGLAGWALARTVVSAADLTLAGSADLVTTAARLGARDVRPAPVLLPDLPAPGRTSAEVREELALDPDAPLVLARGRLEPRSRLDVLVAAAARWRMLAQAPEVVIAGVGPAYRDLAAQAVVARAPVSFAGERAEADEVPVSPAAEPAEPAGSGGGWTADHTSSERATLVDLIHAADIAVVTSARARPLFALQAAQTGVALVVPAGGVVAQLLGPGAAQVPQGDVDALDATVRGLLDDRQARSALGAEGADQARAWPRADRAVDQIMSVYHELRDAPGSGR